MGDVNMNRKNYKKVLALFVMGIILGLSILSVYAYSSADSIWGYYGPQQGHSYMNQSNVTAWADGDGVTGKVTVATQGGESVPVGYMGVNAWLYRGTTLVFSTGWYYNPDSQSVFLKITDSDYHHDYYYADGQTKAYNGNGYYTYDVYSSPIVQY
jgi:hypothetical protein